ncbi:helicase domain protein [Nitzschia inconspicua]|uniref:Helicase domain protein n=1 Tax=Nitzschia inconspicua TaxID=303405 RepID=A0A9K3PEV0_9STRA|nr:helicase domain protein [Nitzschia inconspicua]
MNVAMNYTYQQHLISTQMQYDASISESSDCGTSTSSNGHCTDSSLDSLEPTPLCATQQIHLQLDGRSFYPITDDNLFPIDIASSAYPWEGPTEIEETILASLLSTQTHDAMGNRSTFETYTKHVSDGEISDNSTVSTDIFENDSEFNMEPNSIAFPNANMVPIIQHQQSARPPQQFTVVTPFPIASGTLASLQRQTEVGSTDEDDEVSLSELVSGQDRRFKPFHEEKWNQRYEELLAFRRRHGHAAVPHTYPPNQQLARWIKRQRRQYKLLQDGKPTTLTPDRQEMLDQLGFVWDSHEVNWYQKLESLIEYKRENGNCNVPTNYAKDKKLATWIKCQRRQYKLYVEKRGSSMTSERIAELNKIGFNWEIRRVCSTRAPRTKSSNTHADSASSNSDLRMLLDLPIRQVNMMPPSA